MAMILFLKRKKKKSKPKGFVVLFNILGFLTDVISGIGVCSIKMSIN